MQGPKLGRYVPPRLARSLVRRRRPTAPDNSNELHPACVVWRSERQQAAASVGFQLEVILGIIAPSGCTQALSSPSVLPNFRFSCSVMRDVHLTTDSPDHRVL